MKTVTYGPHKKNASETGNGNQQSGVAQIAHAICSRSGGNIPGFAAAPFSLNLEIVNPRRRILTTAALLLAAAWGMAFAGYEIARHLRVTPEKVRAFLHDTDFPHLTGPARAKALRRLAELLNALSLEERQQARFQGEIDRWMLAMTDEEKGQFLEATLPTGFRQMISAFEQLPEEKRRQAIANSLKGIQEARQRFAAQEQTGTPLPETDSERRPMLSPELQERAVKTGLQTFYDTSSPQMKAELAPVLEALQESMNSGQLFSPPRGPRPPEP